MAFSLKSLLKRKQKDSSAYDADDDDSFAPEEEKKSARSAKPTKKGGSGKGGSGKKQPTSAPLAFLKPLVAKLPGFKSKGASAQAADPFDNPTLLALIASELEALPPPVIERPEPAVPVMGAAPAAAAANDPFSTREEPTLRGLDEPAAYAGAEDDFPGLDGAPPDDPFATDAADDAYQKRRRRRSVVGVVSTAALLIALAGGVWWLFGSPSEPEPWVAEGLTVLNEKGVPISVPPSEAVVSGTRVTMAMPPPPKSPLQAKAETGAALGTEKSPSRRPWLAQGQEGADPAAATPAPAEQSAPAAQPEKPAETAAAPADPAAGKPKVVDPMASLPMLVDPLGPTLRTTGTKPPSYAALPELKTPPAPLKEAPDPDLAKRSPLGILPILGKDGRASWQVYARPFKAQAPLPAAAPRIAVIIGGLGMNPDATDAAILKLPPEVTLAFSPYSPRLDELVKKARAHGHEVMLELPLEPENFPNQDPGPLGLLTILPQIDNLTRLETILGKTTGYVGLLGRMGGKFGASPVHMRPLLEALSKYGLMYVHTASPKGLGDMRGISVPVVQNIVMVDERPFRDAFDARLSYLVTVAKQRGTAIGVSNPSPLAYDRLLAWMATLQGQGVVFAPVSGVTGMPSG
ncbi:divergent polysaccharide deacetylase family protein [Novispirillum itersonii]|uniref:Divergent polysaccharide deacetylase family protein n=1 Tax=Novispirillum itersonii TaxID=189 RepID=A0A7W9ZGY1_NOVIT|nr:divergent polysaccharide deacetylase family protein [Novispirillum itersonii]MBB6209859.1 hypothetical protein [Novispirillum itersonii]